jgi:hypothetical protein
MENKPKSRNNLGSLPGPPSNLFLKSELFTKRQGCQMVYFQTKTPIWVNFGEPWNGKGWHILWPFGIYYGHLVI